MLTCGSFCFFLVTIIKLLEVNIFSLFRVYSLGARKWKHVDWSDLSRRAGDLGPSFLHSCLKSLVSNHVPKNLQNGLRGKHHLFKSILKLLGVKLWTHRVPTPSPLGLRPRHPTPSPFPFPCTNRGTYKFSVARPIATLTYINKWLIDNKTG